jgi:hypothetical protein
VKPENLVFKRKEEKKDCIYYNGETGEGYATVNRGKWYNESLFLYLMKKYQVNNKEQL